MHTEKQHTFYTMIDNYTDAVINVLAISAAYVLAAMLHEPLVNLASPYTVLLLFVISLVMCFFYQVFNLYRPALYYKTYQAVVAIAEVSFVNHFILLVLALLFTREEVREFLLIWILISFIVTSMFLIFKRRVIITVLGYLRKKQFRVRKVIIAGDNPLTAGDFARQITENPQYGYMLLGYIGDHMLPEELGCEKLGGMGDFGDILAKYKPTDVIFAIDSYRKNKLIRLVNICDDRCIRVYFLPVIYGYFKSPKQIEQFGTLPLINIHSNPLANGANAALKRGMDIIGSLLLILLTSPLMLIAAIGIKLTSKGSVLFRQERVGKMGKHFKMLKFRSMCENEEADSAWTAEGDPRITRFGAFLRATSIDELPQLFNVLFGTMSLVGPRPEIPKFVSNFREEIPLYMVKHYVKPGMTGLAQIRGLRGDTSIEDRIQADISYIENWSLALDISILLQTPFRAFNRNEATFLGDNAKEDDAEHPADKKAPEGEEEQ